MEPRFDNLATLPIDADLIVGSSFDDTAVNAAIDLASIDTGNADRDAHLRSHEFLDVERRPIMTFRSTGISGSGEHWTLDGDLTIGDVTEPISSTSSSAASPTSSTARARRVRGRRRASPRRLWALVRSRRPAARSRRQARARPGVHRTRLSPPRWPRRLTGSRLGRGMIPAARTSEHAVIER